MGARAVCDSAVPGRGGLVSPLVRLEHVCRPKRSRGHVHSAGLCTPLCGQLPDRLATYPCLSHLYVTLHVLCLLCGSATVAAARSPVKLAISQAGLLILVISACI